MNYRAKCDKLLAILSGVTDNEAILILDSIKYYNIFLIYDEKYNICDEINNVVMLHIILTRKINIHNSILINRLAVLLDNNSVIEKFLSFYNHDEILTILYHNNYKGFSGWSSLSYKINDASFEFIFVLYCLYNRKIILFNYLVDYLTIHNLSLMVNYQCEFYGDITHAISCNNYILIADHEHKIIYNRSLRNTWIMAISLL